VVAAVMMLLRDTMVLCDLQLRRTVVASAHNVYRLAAVDADHLSMDPGFSLFGTSVHDDVD
jgi:hypothetical protein